MGATPRKEHTREYRFIPESGVPTYRVYIHLDDSNAS